MLLTWWSPRTPSRRIHVPGSSPDSRTGPSSSSSSSQHHYSRSSGCRTWTRWSSSSSFHRPSTPTAKTSTWRTHRTATPPPPPPRRRRRPPEEIRPSTVQQQQLAAADPGRRFPRPRLAWSPPPGGGEQRPRAWPAAPGQPCFDWRGESPEGLCRKQSWTDAELDLCQCWLTDSDD